MGYAESLLQHGHDLPVGMSRVVRLPDQDHGHPCPAGPAGRADLLLVASDGPGVLGHKVPRAYLFQRGVVDVLGERPLGADEVPALETELHRSFDRIHGGEHPGDHPLPVVEDGGVPVELLGARGGEDHTLPVLQVVHRVGDGVDRDDVVVGHFGVLPPQPYVLGTGLLASLADMLRHRGRVRVRGVHNDLVHVLRNHPGDALGPAAAAHLHVDVVIRIHDVSSVVRGDSDVDHHALGC